MNVRTAPPAQEPSAGALDSIRKLIADDGWAISFQTLGQYRTALLAAIRQQEGDK